MNLELNEMNAVVRGKKEEEFIADFEKKFDNSIAEIAQKACAKKSGKFVIAITGPSSSGKTTFSGKLAGEFSKLGMISEIVSLDNFYLNADQIPINESGEPDLESVYALDLEEIKRFFEELFLCRKSKMPIFDFQKRGRSRKQIPIKFGEGTVVIVEGIHGLNEEVTKFIPQDNLYQIYISVKKGFCLQGKELFDKRQVRLFRRLVRDFHYRGTAAKDTFNMWPSVIEGDIKNIKPFQKNADVFLDTSFPYDLGVLKEELSIVLSGLLEDKKYERKVKSILERFENVEAISPAVVPETSILREFIGKKN